jgi:hypothetical protein
MNKQVENEVKKAYADCWMEDENEGHAQRNLNFKTSKSVTIEEAISLFQKYVKGYNDFVPGCLKPLKQIDSFGEVTIAREGSVCVYFKTDVELSGSEMESYRNKTKADEFDFIGNNTYRIWWD